MCSVRLDGEALCNQCFRVHIRGVLVCDWINQVIRGPCRPNPLLLNSGWWVMDYVQWARLHVM